MSRRQVQATNEALLDEVQLTLDELCGLAGVTAPWVRERLASGLLDSLDNGVDCRFDVAALRRARAMARLERDFDAVPELAALVVDLQDEIEALRARLRWVRQ